MERTYCERCGTYRFKPAGELCCHCRRSQDPTEAASAASRTSQIVTTQPVTFGGHVIDAPGFTQDQFERAMCRALVDELEIHTDETGLAIVTHRGVNGGYRVTRTSCDCRAGEIGIPCKHRAFYLFHTQVRIPAVRKEWAKVQAERAAETGVA